jgi:hypothetical protein
MECSPVPPRSLDDRIPAQLEDACLRALNKDPARRFRTAGDFGRALQSAVAPTSRRAWLVLVAVTAASAAGLLWCVWPGQAGPPLQLYTPIIQVARNGALCDVKPDRPLAAGENLKIVAQLAHGQSAHLYVIVFSSDRTEGQVLCPNAAAGFAEGTRRSYELPLDQFVTVPQGTGAVAVVVGACRKPLRAETLARFVKTRIRWPAPCKNIESFPAEESGTENRHPHARGGLFDFPAGLRYEDLDGLFASYYARLFPWFEASRSPDSP